MTEIHVIDLLDATHNGPAAIGPSGEEQEVHLQQGSLDGACGPYSLLMCLLICGLIERSAIISSYYSKQTSIGKILKRIKDGQGLFIDGTGLGELKKFIAGTFPKKLEIETIEKSGVDVRSFVEKHVKENHPVIMGMEFPGGGHWVVAIGLEYSRENNGALTLCRIQCLILMTSILRSVLGMEWLMQGEAVEHTLIHGGLAIKKLNWTRLWPCGENRPPGQERGMSATTREVPTKSCHQF